MATCTVCQIHAESTFKVQGMDCRDEVALIERRFKQLSGLEDFTADVVGQRLHVKYDAAKLSTSTIAEAVADAGMRVWLEHEAPLEAPTSTGPDHSTWVMRPIQTSLSNFPLVSSTRPLPLLSQHATSASVN